MALPEMHQKFKVKRNNVDPEVLAYSQSVFQKAILENPVIKNLARFIPKRVEKVPTYATQKMADTAAVAMMMLAPIKHLLKEDETDQAESLVYKTDEIILEGKSKMVFDPNYKDVTLVVGNSGTGKSTLVQFIAGDISELEAVETDDGFVIEDTHDKISKNDKHFQSMTLFPELIINEAGTLAFYDCPGFKDNRGPAVAMATSHFTKLVFDEADKIKVHICVDYGVTKGADRGESFIAAIKRVAEIIDDAEKFKPCFSMTATKVPLTYVYNKEIKKNVPKTDAAEIKMIGDKIKNGLIPHLRNMLNETDENEKHFLSNVLTVFEALSTMENGEYVRIGLFRAPKVAGSLLESEEMMKSKETIMSAIENKTDFVVVTKGDFSYTIDDATKVQMLNAAKRLNVNLDNEMNFIGDEIEKYCAGCMRESNNWRKTYAFLKEVKTTLDEESKKLKSLPELRKTFISKLGESLSSVHVTISKKNLMNLERQLRCLAFLEDMFHEISTIIPMTSLNDAYKFVTQAAAWYKTLFGAYGKLSTHKYQVNKDNYNVANLNDWGKSGKELGLRVSAETAPYFFELLEVDIDELGDLALTDRMNELNYVVYLTLVEKMKIRVTQEGELLATGPFILLSRVVEEYKKKEDLVKTVNIFATCGFYVDIDFNAPGRHMIIASPKWKVMNKFEISLDGKSGEEKNWSAENGRGVTPGEDGTPGGSGKSGGHFVGIADSVDSAQFLTITSNGGKGGKGQAGGKGGMNAAGVDAKPPPSYDVGFTPQEDEDYPFKVPPGEAGKDFTYLGETSGMRQGAYLSGWFHQLNSFLIFGEKAKDGEPGGSGGVGGFGGSKGDVIMVICSPTSNYPTIRNKDGFEGENGAGGEGGDGAKHGEDYKVDFSRSRNHSLESMFSRWRPGTYIYTGQSSSGPRGECGGNIEGRVKEEQVLVTEMAKYLNHFKSDTISFAANSPLLRAELQMMLSSIDQTEKCNALYTIPAYLNEMTTLENLYFSIFKSIDTTPFYRSLLNRINVYANAHKSTTDKIKRVALSTIYTACLSKLCSLKLENRSQGIVVNLVDYMGLTLKKIDDLATIDKITAVKGFQKLYHESFDLKVKEANDLMDHKVKPAINIKLRSMDDYLDMLVQEVVDKTEAENVKKSELIELKKKMERALVGRFLLNLLKIGANFVSFAGPIGACVGGVITAGVTVGESYIVDPNVKPAAGTSLLPPGVSNVVKHLGDFVVELRTKKFEKFEKQLKSTMDELTNPPVDLEDVCKEVTSIQELINKEKAEAVSEGNEAASIAKVEELRKKLNEVLIKKKTGLSEQIGKGGIEKKYILDKVEKIQKGLKVIETVFDVHKRYEGDKKKLDEISEQIEDADQKIQSLQLYEREIQSAMFPMVRRIRDDVNKVAASLSTKSQVALDVTKWEVQGTLCEIRNKLAKAMEGFAVETEMSGCFDSLKEAMNLLIHIYERLENFHDQQRLGDFIANINAPGDFDELLRGTEYEDDVRALNMAIKSNLVLLEYHNSMKIFLQWVFPFAKTYLEKTSLPDSLKPVRDEQTLKDLVVAAKKKLESVKDDITQYWATISTVDEFIINGTFYHNAKVGGPFYVWSAKEYANVIKDIFNGEGVTLYADIRNSAQFKNARADKRKAIKFSKVYLRFNLAKKYEEKEGDEEAKKKNAKRQARFEDILEYFVVNMVHTGASYYDFQDNIYVTYGDPVHFSYSMKVNSYGIPEIRSSSRDKLTKGDVFLSPYTLWKIELTADETKAYDDMNEFVEDISLELAGEGIYIYDKYDKLAAYDLQPYIYYQIDENIRDTTDSI